MSTPILTGATSLNATRTSPNPDRPQTASPILHRSDRDASTGSGRSASSLHADRDHHDQPAGWYRHACPAVAAHARSIADVFSGLMRFVGVYMLAALILLLSPGLRARAGASLARRQRSHTSLMPVRQAAWPADRSTEQLVSLPPARPAR